MPGEPQAEAARILVVDDEASIVDAVATALRYEGFTVEEARNGRDALAAVERFKPNLLILDWRLPDFEGIEISRRLREQGLQTPILFVTATDTVEDKAEALRAGGNDYLTKPFSLNEITTRVHAMLKRSPNDSAGDDRRRQDRTST